jgi:hypothetical protein
MEWKLHEDRDLVYLVVVSLIYKNMFGIWWIFVSLVIKLFHSQYQIYFSVNLCSKGWDPTSHNFCCHLLPTGGTKGRLQGWGRKTSSFLFFCCSYQHNCGNTSLPWQRPLIQQWLLPVFRFSYCLNPPCHSFPDPLKIEPSNLLKDCAWAPWWPSAKPVCHHCPVEEKCNSVWTFKLSGSHITQVKKEMVK